MVGFASVPPLAFLDDTTVKNVIVAGGRCTGIVDVDGVCFGDRLFPVALTRTALLNQDLSSHYTDAWLALLDATDRERAALHLYTAVFCCLFLGEIGQRFNREPDAPDPRRIERLYAILDDELLRAEG